MKLYDCIDQLTEMVNIYNSTTVYSSHISNALIRHDRTKLVDISIIDTVRCMYDIEKLPVDIKNEMLDCINLSDMDNKVEELYTVLYNTCIKNPYLKHYITIPTWMTEYKSYDAKQKFKKLELVIKNIFNETFDEEYLKLLHNITDGCLKARNILINYVNSFNVPTKSDWEYNEEKRRNLNA